jgi:hypothetical protein
MNDKTQVAERDQKAIARASDQSHGGLRSPRQSMWLRIASA